MVLWYEVTLRCFYDLQQLQHSKHNSSWTLADMCKSSKQLLWPLISAETYAGWRNETCYFGWLFKLTGQSNGDYSHCILRSTMCWGEAFAYQTTALCCCSKNNLNIKSFALQCPFQTYPHYTQLQTKAILMFTQVLLLHQMKSGTWLTPTLTHSTRKKIFSEHHRKLKGFQTVTAPAEEFSLNKVCLIIHTSF